MEIKRRKLFERIRKFIDDKEIIVIHGSRQVGKTSLLFYIMNNYLKKRVDEKNVFYFDLEDFRLLELCNSSYEDVIAYIKAKGADFKKKVYLLIDEIQYLKNPSSFLKLFFDRYAGKVKLIVSGSSTFLIRKKFKDSLAGRILDFELFTLDFEEFLDFKGLRYSLGGTSPLLLETHRELSKLYAQFVIYGGYPAIVLEDIVEKKEIKLQQIINTYVKRDIRDIAEIREVDKFNALIKILASQTGQMLNILELSNTIGLAKETVQEYLFILENTYIIRRVSPFHENLRSEITKMPKVFFEDTGLANLLANRTFSENIGGGLLENSVYSELRKNMPVEDLYFWRTANRQEIDFIVERTRKGKREIMALEVKHLFLNKHTSNLRYFQKEYKNVSAYFCPLDKREETRDKAIHIIYPWQLSQLYKGAPN